MTAFVVWHVRVYPRFDFYPLKVYAGPRLLGSDGAGPRTEAEPEDWRQLPKHKDEEQVKLDVNRSFIYYPSSAYDIALTPASTDRGLDQSEKQLDRRKEDLSDVITEVLRRHPALCYFQGFHDIVQVLLLVLGKELAVGAVTHLSLLRIRDFMLPSLSPSLAHLSLLPAILYSADSKLCQHLSQTKPYFALAATLTLYAHEIQDYGVIARLFDFLLTEEAVASLYLFTVIILSRKNELLEIPANEPEMLHFTLSKLPQSLDVEDLVRRTGDLFLQHPPDRLPFRAWCKISSYSVLKTTRGPHATQNLMEGKELLAKQIVQLQREDFRRRLLSTMWKYRRPAGGIGLALLVGLISFWVQKGALGNMSWLGMRKLWSFLKHLRG